MIAEEVLDEDGARVARKDFSRQGIQELAAAVKCCSQLKELVWTCKSLYQQHCYLRMQMHPTFACATVLCCGALWDGVERLMFGDVRDSVWLGCCRLRQWLGS